MIYEHRTEFAGLPIASPEPDTSLHGEAAWVLSLEFEATEAFDELVAGFVALPGSDRVRALVIGNWDHEYSMDQSSEEVVRSLAASAGQLPELRALFLGDVIREEMEISWIRQSDITPLLEAFPALERLEIRGGVDLELRPVTHPSLQVLRMESGGLPGPVVAAISRSELPALTRLELWLGTEQYGGNAGVADLAGILSGAGLPALTHLGLQDSEIQDEIAAAVASAPIVARLETLDLSMGALSDEGAEALLAGQPLTHLRGLNLSHHFLTDAMMERVRGALPGVEVDLGDRQKPDGERFYIAVSE
ncbi:STM4015 family protein [Rhizohabitans arisaemae]|uniref:STM4015 family protein n=1 Tax=Rhizohabitans arisaemae TaxID=2720610 RepID=UPI0024B092D3|nr:STM4015 family protein [Rhizohabitans arisaemae]